MTHLKLTLVKNLMSEINVKQLETFKSSIKSDMDKKFYLCIFFGCFFGSQYFPMSEKQYNKIKYCDNKKFIGYCHAVIDNAGLCNEENIFFHGMVNIIGTENFIEKCFELYHKTKNLEHCKLGPNILRCLETSTNIKIY